MPRYSQNSISEVSRANNIVDVVSSYVQLKRNGTSFTGLCPFHKEKTPSFHVSEDKQLFYCFGCGAGGNIYDFVMRIENLDFVEALKFLAQRAGIQLEEEQSSYRESRDEHNLKQRIYEMNVKAARHFVNNLLDKEAKSAHEYVVKRGLDRHTITRFGIGYAKDEWTDLTEYLKAEGYSPEEIVTAGLAVRNDKGRVYDKFRNRLMFPIINVRGSVVAFGGRALGEDPAKYMNSPETPVFFKGRNLFALNVAKQYGLKQGIILVEGYMDVVSLNQRGIPNVVAGLGTAFTLDQAKLLKRYASEVYVCYDSDEAGQKATLKAIDILAEAGNVIKVVQYTGAKDPDEFILKKGSESFRDLLNNAKAAVEYKILRIRKEYDITEVTEKVAFVNEAAQILSQVENTVEREAYVKRISLETDISQEAINAEINKLIYAREKKAVKKEVFTQNRLPAEVEQARTASVESGSTTTYKAERMLLNIIFFHQKAYEMAKEEADGSLFANDTNSKIFDAIMAYKSKTQEADASGFLSFIDGPLKQQAAAILYKEYQCDSAQAVRDTITKLKGELMNNRMKQLAKEGKVEEINELIRKNTGRRG